MIPRPAALCRLLILTASLLSAALACDVCAGQSVHQEPATDILLPADGDLTSCACSYLFAYSAGPTPGRVILSAPPNHARIVVYGDAAGTDVLADIPATSSVDELAVFSRTGTIRVDLTTVAAAPTESVPISISATAINTAPVLEERDDLVLDFQFGVFTSLYPWTPEGTPLPVTLRDYDNFDQGLRAEIELGVAIVGFQDPTVGVVVPAVPDLVFEVGAANTLLREVVVSGPGSAVETAVNNAVLVPFDLFLLSTDTLDIRVNDFGNSGEGGNLRSTYDMQIGVYATGVIDVPRGATLLTNGAVPPEGGAEAVYLVHDAFHIVFVRLDLPPADDGSCPSFVRVWDGPDIATARLISTELFLSGEMCAESNQVLPAYSGTTGEFVVEFHTLGGPQSSFDTIVSATPIGFRAWLAVDNALEVSAGGNPLRLPQIMVTSLPDPADVAVNITVSAGALSLRFADSFVDLVQESTDTMISLALTEADGVPAMLRMGDALREVQYAAAEIGPAVLRVEAWSGGVAAEALELAVNAVAVAINAPSALSIHAFQPVSIPVSLDASGLVTASVVVEGGLGQVSLDPRAALWIDIGYGSSVTATGTASEVNAALSGLVYKATEGGGLETIVVEVGGAERRIEVTVDPDCEGQHFVYGRVGTFTERAGPPGDRYGSDMQCVWFIFGPRELRFPFFDLRLPSAFIVEDAGGDAIFIYTFREPGLLRASQEAYFQVFLQASGTSHPGFVGSFQSTASINDPPLIVVPEGLVRVVRGSTTRLRTLYVDDFEEGVIVASLETDAGSLQEEGTRRIEIEAATFEELDAWVTGIDFLAGNVQTTATLTLTATDEGGAEGVAQFQIEVLPCSGTAEIVLNDGSGSVPVDDDSDTENYVDGLSCGWRLTGAPGPAALEVAFLDLDCAGDAVTVYDGSSVAGRLLGSFCQTDGVETEVGTLVSSTGSFFLELVSNGDGLVGDGFLFVYGAVAAGATTSLGAAPEVADPERADATVIALDGESVAVFGGFNGVRAVATTLVFVVGDGWRVLAGEGPAARSRAAGAALSASQVVVHGGVGVDGTPMAETWIGDIDGDAIVWTQLDESGPATDAAAMHVHNGAAHLVDASGVWVLGDGDRRWSEIGSTPTAVVPTTSAYRRADGLVYATDADGAVWTVSLASGDWAALGVELEVECAAWTCSGAMLGSDEYAVDGHRVNVSSLAVDVLPGETAGWAVGGQYLGQPSLFVYGGGAMTVVPLTLGVSSHGPLVTPVFGGTTITLAGEQLSSCQDPMCVFGTGQAAATVTTERTATCATPSETEAGTVGSVALLCADGRRFSSPDPLVYYGDPTIESVEPTDPDPGDTVLVTLGGISEETLALVDAPLCRFDMSHVVAAALDGAEARCRVPEAVPTGTTVTLEVSLDGQQFVGAPGEVQVRKPEAPLFNKSRATLAGLVLAGVLAVLAIILYFRTPNRPSRTVIFSVAIGIVDLYFDVVFINKLRDEGSYLANYSFGTLVFVVSVNLFLVTGLVIRKTRLSSGRHAFVEWLETQSGAMFGLSIACTLGISRISSLGLLMTRMGGLGMFDAGGVTSKDWHMLAALDVVWTLAEDITQLAIQGLYLSGGDARIDVITVVTVTLSATMVVSAGFQGLGRVIVFGAVKRRSSIGPHDKVEAIATGSGNVGPEKRP